jgi:hypothetical protein
MADVSPNAQTSGGTAAFCQRVEDNAFAYWLARMNAKRWIGFSEDDGNESAKPQTLGGEAAFLPTR